MDSESEAWPMGWKTGSPMCPAFSMKPLLVPNCPLCTDSSPWQGSVTVEALKMQIGSLVPAPPYDLAGHPSIRTPLYSRMSHSPCLTDVVILPHRHTWGRTGLLESGTGCGQCPLSRCQLDYYKRRRGGGPTNRLHLCSRVIPLHTRENRGSNKNRAFSKDSKLKVLKLITTGAGKKA